MRSRARRFILAFALLASALGPPCAFAGTVVERTVAFVNKKPVLLSDVELTKALLKLDEKEAVERAIDEALMFEDASRLVTEPLPEATVAPAVASLKAKAGPGFTDVALRRKALVQLAIANYIELRLRPQVRVEDDAVRQVFNERVAREPQSPPFILVADAIRESLESRALDQKIEEWVASLRRRGEIRRVAARP
jgi:hypothetical protein